MRDARATSRAALALLASSFAGAPLRAEVIGSVDTEFKFIGPDHKIVVEAFDDPDVPGVACYVSRAKTGGVKGAIGMAEDPTRFSVACRQVGPVSFPRPLEREEQVFEEGASLVWKHVRVVRMVDAKRATLVYLTYSDRVIDGSPDNAVTAVPVPGARIPLAD